MFNTTSWRVTQRILRGVRNFGTFVSQRTFAHQQTGGPDTTGMNPVARWGEMTTLRRLYELNRKGSLPIS